MKKYFVGVILAALIIIFSINPIFGETLTTSDLDKIKEVADLINQDYKDDVSKEALVNSAISGMMEALDPHSTYMTKEQYEGFKESLGEGYSGIGVGIKKVDSYIVIMGIMDDSPAKKAGLKAGDRFYSVDGENVVNMNEDVFVSKVKGPKGTAVRIGVLRDDSKNPIYFDIVRDTVTIDPVEYKTLDNKIGYIKISDFSENLNQKVQGALDYFDYLGIQKIIIDLRGNGGGYLDQAVKLGGKFIPKGPIVHIKTKNEPEMTYYSNLLKPKYKLAVLVDGGSASASEIFSGAVQDSGSGTLIGTQTYGKGTVQTIFQLKAGDYIKLTIANYSTPKERNIDGKGLTPDIVVENKNNLINSNMFEPLNSFRNIGLWNRGYDVLAIEQRLHALGYLSVEPDYSYGFESRKAVIQFEKDNNLPLTGIITQEFQDSLINIIKEVSEKDYQLEKAIQILNN